MFNPKWKVEWENGTSGEYERAANGFFGLVEEDGAMFRRYMGDACRAKSIVRLTTGDSANE